MYSVYIAVCLFADFELLSFWFCVFPRVFTNKEPDDVSIIETPYGGRLMFVMPDGNMLYIHLKDKLLIRNKKRWSQVSDPPSLLNC